MNKSHQTKVLFTKIIAPNTYKITIQLDSMPEILPGQFLNVQIPNGKFLLRRPFGICDFDTAKKTIDFCFLIKGEGTRELSKIKPGDQLNIILPLGNGFPTDFRDKKVMIIGGGIGSFPLLAVAKYFKNNYTFLGFRTKDQAVLLDEFKNATKELIITSDDGSILPSVMNIYNSSNDSRCERVIVEKGFCTNIAKLELDRIKPDVIFACGPEVMFKSMQKIFSETDTPIYISTEQRMACGFGACLCCNQLIEKNGVRENLRVCCEGPVFKLKEIVL